MKNKSLDFVARYYRHGALDIKSAYHAALQKARGTKLNAQNSKLKAQWLAAAAIAVLLVGGALLFFSPSFGGGGERLFASADSIRTFTLQDGTVVTLAPHSTLSYKGDCREVELTGKAYLNIHHDASHPFTIKDENYIIKDIGTRLMVDEASPQPSPIGEGDAVSVYVEEGSVSFASTNKHSANIVLHKGQGAAMTGNGQPKRIANVSQNMTAWATREFHFDNTPLPDVLHDLSAYYGVRLVLDDSGINQSSNLKPQISKLKRLTADFHADSLQTIVNMIEETLDVEIKTE